MPGGDGVCAKEETQSGCDVILGIQFHIDTMVSQNLPSKVPFSSRETDSCKLERRHNSRRSPGST